MLSWLEVSPPFGWKAVDLVELFAGKGRITRLAAARGWNVLCHDMKFDASAHESGRQNCMDLTKSAGFLLLDLDSCLHALYSFMFCMPACRTSL